ncbi:MAG: AAA family ATPase [Candidatus Marinimicrobia bacterium]|nr:AAA family ATPase [Candidatus Neomarinimicrobiota bacterium]
MESQFNIDEIVNAFREAMLDAGIAAPDEIIADGEIHRFHIPEDKAGSKDGWYVLHADLLPAGEFGDWRTIRQAWNAKSGAKLSKSERDALTKNMRLIKQKRIEELRRRQEKARDVANDSWKNAKLAPDTHLYLQTKGVKSHGLRFDGQALLVPMRDKDGTLWSFQRIYENGEKRNLADGRKSGCYHALGVPDKRIYVSESYSTGASIHEATDEAVAIAFGTDNVKTVAKVLRQKFPSIEIVIAGDDDRRKKGNPGRTKAFEAAIAVDGLVALPVFQHKNNGTDFNDLMAQEGPVVVREQLGEAIRPGRSHSSTESDAGITSPFVLESGYALLSREFKGSEPLIEEILGANKKIVVAAPDGVGKSLITHQMAIALAVGLDEFLGFKVPRARRVLLLNFEMSAEQIHERHIKLCSILSPEQKERLDNLHVNTLDADPALFQDNWKRIRATVEANPRFDFLSVDNLYAATGADDESNRELKPLLSEIFSIANIHKSTMLLVTHDKKHQPDTMISKHLIRGGSTIANSMDVILQMAMSLKTPGLRLLKITKNRDRSPNLNKTFALKLDPDNLWFHNQGLVKEAAHLQYPRPLKGLEVLAKMEEKFATKTWLSAVEKITGRSRRTAFNWIGKILDAGLVKMDGWGGYEKLH